MINWTNTRLKCSWNLLYRELKVTRVIPERQEIQVTLVTGVPPVRTVQSETQDPRYGGA